MKYHYVYRITNSKLNKHYYGVRTSRIEPKLDLGIKYFSSSTDKHFIKDQKENHGNYKYKIVQIFSDRKSAIELEIKLHKRLDVGVNESFYNRAKQTSAGWDTTGTKLSESHIFSIKLSNTGRIKSKEEIKKLSNSHKGKIFTDKHKRNLSLSKLGKPNLKLKGVKKTEEHKRNMRKPKLNKENMVGNPGKATFIDENGNKVFLKIKEAKERGLNGESKGRKYSDEINKKKGRKGEENDMYGKKLSEETKIKISNKIKNTITCFDLEEKIMKRIPKKEFYEFKNVKYVGPTSKLVKEYYENKEN